MMRKVIVFEVLHNTLHPTAHLLRSRSAAELWRSAYEYLYENNL